jgi:HTH-type transcriptional regulator / antitoxin HigA
MQTTIRLRTFQPFEKRSKMTRSEYHVKLKRMEELLTILTLRGKLPMRLQTELDAVSEDIADYEEVHYPFEPESLKDMIELRMYQRKLKQKDVAEILGTTPSRISEILNGKRKLTLDQAKGLYKKLNIDAELILSTN